MSSPNPEYTNPLEARKPIRSLNPSDVTLEQEIGGGNEMEKYTILFDKSMKGSASVARSQ